VSRVFTGDKSVNDTIRPQDMFLAPSGLSHDLTISDSDDGPKLLDMVRIPLAAWGWIDILSATAWVCRMFGHPVDNAIAGTWFASCAPQEQGTACVFHPVVFERPRKLGRRKRL
jgi:hypothetical protein